MARHIRRLTLGAACIAVAVGMAPPARADDPAARNAAITMLTCHGTLASLPSIESQEATDKASAYATFLGGMGTMIADDNRIPEAARAAAIKAGGALIRPPHTAAEITSQIHQCLMLAEQIRETMNKQRGGQ